MTEEKSIIQRKAIDDILRYVRKNSPFYKKHFKDFNSEDFTSLPFTTKQNISEQNDEFCCVKKEEIAEYVTTSGTSGSPVTIYLTKNDLDRLAENERASLTLMNGSDKDLYQLLTTIDKQFMAGIAYYLGVQKMNAGMIRLGPGAIPAQWDSILKYQPTKLIAVPSFILNLIEYAEKNGIEYNSTSIDSVICIGEPIRDNEFNYNTLGKKITSKWNVDLYSTYASTEMAAAFSECSAQNGGHLNNELLHLEVLSLDDEQVSNGEAGEIVVTTLGVEGTPLVRYRTGDIASYWSEKCRCGLETPRVGPIIGRKNQLIKYRGTSIYPQAIYNVLNSINEINLYHLEVEQEDMTTQKLSVILAQEEIAEERLSEIAILMKAKLKITPDFRLLPIDKLKSILFDNKKRKPNYITFK